MGLWQQISALVWKNTLIKKRSPFSTLFEVFFPVVAFLLIAKLSSLSNVTHHDADHAVGDGVDLSHHFEIESMLDTFARLSQRGELLNPHIAFAPCNKYTDDLQTYLINSSTDLQPSFSADMFLCFDGEAELIKHIKDKRYYDDPSYPRIYAAITTSVDADTAVAYSIRTNSTSELVGTAPPDSEAAPFDLYAHGLSLTGFQSYLSYHHHFLQAALDEIVLFHHGASPLDLSSLTAREVDARLKVRLQPLPARAYEEDVVLYLVRLMLGALVFVTYMYPMKQVVAALVEEKELKLRVGLQMMGLRSFAFYASWVVLYLLMYGVSSLCSSVALILVLPHSSFVLILLVFLLFSAAFIALSCLISTVFSKVKTAVNASAIVFVALYLLSLAAENGSRGMLLLSCLSPQAALTLFLGLAFRLEQSAQGVTFHNLTERGGVLSFADVTAMLLFDIVLFLLVTVYLDAVWPGENKVTKPLYYPLTALTACCRSATNTVAGVRGRGGRDGHEQDLLGAGAGAYEHFTDDGDGGRESSDAVYDDAAEVDPSKIEPVPPHLRDRVGISIRNLRKEFPTEMGPLAAVKRLNVEMYDGQIFALLGHNASGKTTTISMLTGLYSPTAGTATVHGYDVRSQMDQIQQVIGVCPQSDVLFPQLTVLEHMQLYSRIKGLHGNDHAIAQLLREVSLSTPGDDKTHCLATTLSGGQKRKLCLALAMVGDPRVLFLDEPTSGMDVAAQRHVWELLLRAKRDRVIILTTHSLEEAEIADRIAILNHGQLRCCGSSLFLKHAYNVGYTLSVTKASPSDRTSTSTDTPTSACATQLVGILAGTFPWAKFLKESPREISFQLPLSETANFPALLRLLDAQKSALCIGDYGLSVKTLTDVFLQSSSVDAKDAKHKYNGASDALQDTLGSSDADADGESTDALTRLWSDMRTPSGLHLYAVQLHAMVAKRVHMARRDVKHMLYVTLYPVFMICLVVFLLSLSSDTDPRALTTDLYPRDTPFEYIEGYSPDADAYNAAIAASVPHVVPVAVPVDAAHALVEDVYTRQQRFLDTVDLYAVQKPRFGSITFGKIENFSDKDTFRFEATVFFNSTAPDSSMVFASALTNIRMRAAQQYHANRALAAPTDITDPTGITATPAALASPADGAVVVAESVDMDGHAHMRADASSPLSSVSASAATVTVTNHPFPRSSSRTYVFVTQLALAYVMVTVISIFPSAAVVGIVRERADHGKHLQFISGVSPMVYWLGNYVADLAMFLVPSALVVLTLIVLGLDTYMGNATMLFGALWLFYLAAAPLSYALSFFFQKHSTAQAVVMAYHTLGTVLLIVPTLICIGLDSPHADTLITFGSLHPSFAFTLLCLAKNPALTLDAVAARYDTIIAMFFVDAVLYCLLLAVIEYGAVHHLWQAIERYFIRGESVPRVASAEEEEDVKAEREAIERGEFDDPSAYPLVVRGVRKVYPGGHVAVKNIYFAVPRGSVFGFLGANGAGKSTVMSCITGDLLPASTSGPVTLNMKDIFADATAARQRIGYCPQHDALLPSLTAREHLYLYARLKGVSGPALAVFADALLNELGLRKYADRTVGSLSQGTKRRLSVAVALVGNPSLVLLDEPSTGVDPASAMDMWEVIRKSMRRRSVILTSHSMLEVEALCDRVAIMVRGELRCLGTQQALKSKYGRGWQLTVKAAHGWVDAVVGAVREAITGAHVTEVHGSVVRFHVDKQSCSLVQLLEGMEGVKARLAVDPYATQGSNRSLLAAPAHVSPQGAVRIDIPGAAATAAPVGGAPTLDTTSGAVENGVVGGVETYSVSDTELDQIFISLMGADA